MKISVCIRVCLSYINEFLYIILFETVVVIRNTTRPVRIYTIIAFGGISNARLLCTIFLGETRRDVFLNIFACVRIRSSYICGVLYIVLFETVVVIRSTI